MVRPLYTAASGVAPSRIQNGNAGLWYDKFCDQWCTTPHWSMQASTKENRGSSPKLKWMAALTGQAVGVSSELAEITGRLIRLSLGRNGRSLAFRSESRFVTGLGRSHPVENGFAWHPTLGTPYLPGSSIKGMVRAWADQQADPPVDPSTKKRLFGAPGQVGSVSFLDAVPLAPVKLETDVLTPHSAGWSPADPPGDWRSPVPIPFLVAAEGMALLFTVVPCGPLAAGDMELVESWLVEALSWAGAGAKTSVGYGRMALDRQITEDLVQSELEQRQRLEQAQAQAERLASLDPLDRLLEELALAEPALEAYRTWLKAILSGRWTDDPATARQVLQRIKAAMQLIGDWKEHSAKKNPAKDKEHQRTLDVKRLIAET